jgi:hypothetical protein
MVALLQQDFDDTPLHIEQSCGATIQPYLPWPVALLPAFQSFHLLSLQIQAAALRGLSLPADPTAIPRTPAFDRVDSAASSNNENRPSFSALLATMHRQHPALTKPPVSSALAVPAPTLRALLRLLNSLHSQAVKGENDMEIDQEQPLESRNKFGEGYLTLLEHALVRCAINQHVQHKHYCARWTH